MPLDLKTTLLVGLAIALAAPLGSLRIAAAADKEQPPAEPAPAQIKPGLRPFSLFSDNAVLQRAAKVPVWGTSDSREPVHISFAGQVVTAAVRNGRWRADLVDLKYGGSHTLVIAQGKRRIEAKNILVGEVWLCGGQSNMQWTVSMADGGKEAARTAGNPNLRLYTDPIGRWEASTPESVPNFSAVGYYFGRALQPVLGVPVGLVSSNQGGTTVERWISREAIECTPAVKQMPKPQGASDLWERKIRPLVPYAMRGVIWYQGESNVDHAYQYRDALTLLVRSWRAAWERGTFPFLVVQLAPIDKPSAQPQETVWAELRESQRLACNELERAPLCVITDLGDVTVHPPRKAGVGERLARIARGAVYGEKLETSGPAYKSHEVKGDHVMVQFIHVGQGLVVKGDKLTGFTIAGADRKFHPAEATIERETVVVRSAKVRQPVAVRYGWASYPVVNLWNKDGLPASPFRTDTFRLRSQPTALKPAGAKP